MPIVVPEYDFIMVFTGWTILPDKPRLTRREAIDCVLAAVSDRRGDRSKP